MVSTYSSTSSSSLPVPRTSQASVFFNSTPNFHALTSKTSSYNKSLSTKAHASSEHKNLYVKNVNGSSSKVTIIGSPLGIGPALSTSLKESTLVSKVRFYSIGSSDHLKACLDASLSHDHISGLKEALKHTNVVVIATPFPIAEGTLEEHFIVNAMMVRACVEEVAAQCPDAFIVMSNRMLNSIVPMAAEVLKQRGVYDPKKLFGLMTPEIELARAFVAERFVLDVEDVHVPVIGGHSTFTALPLFSKTRPHVILHKDDIILWTSEITDIISNCSEHLDYFAGNPDREYFEAKGAERFVLSLLRALGGADDVFQCCFVESNMFEDIPFFGSTVKLGKKGVEAFIETDLEGLTEYEAKCLKYLKEDLIEDIEKGIEFAKRTLEA